MYLEHIVINENKRTKVEDYGKFSHFHVSYDKGIGRRLLLRHIYALDTST